jgi:hypothetical protein
MDTKALIREAHARFDHNHAKQLLKEKYQAKLLVANQGGLWKVTPELLVFVDSADSSELILLDSYENPIKVDRNQLLSSLRDTYNNVMLEWHEEFQTLRHKR